MALYISSTLDMRNIILEGTIVADNPDDAYAKRQRFFKYLVLLNGTPSTVISKFPAW